MTASRETLILDSAAWADTLKQREERVRGEPTPVRWNSMLDAAVDKRIARARLARPWQRGVYLTAHLFATTIVAAALRRPLVYLSWGVSYHRGLRRRLAKMILQRASVVLVNDDRTQDEVRALAGVDARKVPYLVDTHFYRLAPADQREDFLFCPGENDRDGDVLLSLAERGHRVIWLNNTPALAAQYAGRSTRLELVSALTFEELRGYYQRCRAVVSPMARDIHAAGQTTTLEALACGCTVLIGAGRTADLFSQDDLVAVVSGKDPEAWEAAIEKAVAADRREMSKPAARSALMDQRHGVAAVSNVMIEVIGAVRDR